MLFEYGSRDSDGSSFGLAASDAEGNVTMKLSGSYDTVVEIHGNSSYPIDWDYWHHYCLTYDGSDITLYFDGVSEATATAPLDTMSSYSIFVGSDIFHENFLTGALDELYIYESALDAEAIYVLYSTVTAAPTLTPAPSSFYFEGTLVSYYSFENGNATDAQGGYDASINVYNAGTESYDEHNYLSATPGRSGEDALPFDGSTYVYVPLAAVTETISPATMSARSASGLASTSGTTASSTSTGAETQTGRRLAWRPPTPRAT